MRWPTTAAPAAPAAPASVRLERLDDEGYVSFVATARAAAADELLVAAFLLGKGVEECLHLGRTLGLDRAGLAGLGQGARRLQWRCPSWRPWGWAGRGRGAES